MRYLPVPTLEDMDQDQEDLQVMVDLTDPVESEWEDQVDQVDLMGQVDRTDQADPTDQDALC